MSKKQNPEEEQTKVTKEEMANVMSLLKFAKFWESESGRPPPETIRDPISYLQSLFGMNREETIAFAKINLALSDLMRERLGKSKAALSLSGFLMPHEASNASAGFGNHATHERTRRLEAAAAADAAVVNQENKPTWWQQKREDVQQRQEQMEIHSVPYRADQRGKPGEERRLAATRIQAIQRRRSSAKKEKKLREEEQQKKRRKKISQTKKES